MPLYHPPATTFWLVRPIAGGSAITRPPNLHLSYPEESPDAETADRKQQCGHPLVAGSASLVLLCVCTCCPAKCSRPSCAQITVSASEVAQRCVCHVPHHNLRCPARLQLCER
eukprot:4834613-Amphidinium_carterae.1